VSGPATDPSAKLDAPLFNGSRSLVDASWTNNTTVRKVPFSTRKLVLYRNTQTGLLALIGPNLMSPPLRRSTTLKYGIPDAREGFAAPINRLGLVRRHP